MKFHLVPRLNKDQYNQVKLLSLVQVQYIEIKICLEISLDKTIIGHFY
jgi:hypothetical protein